MNTLMGFLFAIGIIMALGKKRYFLALSCLVISFTFGKLADWSVFGKILVGTPDWAIIMAGIAFAGSFFIVDRLGFAALLGERIFISLAAVAVLVWIGVGLFTPMNWVNDIVYPGIVFFLVVVDIFLLKEEKRKISRKYPY